MPPLIVVFLLGAGAYAGLKTAHVLWDRLADARMHSVEGVESVGTSEILEKNLGSLEFDPATGVYRPVGRG